MRRAELGLDKIKDPAVRSAFDVVAGEVISSPFSGFRGKHFSITKPSGTYTYVHRLGFRPQDVLQTSLRIRTGTCTFVWNYDLFTKTHLSFTITTSVASEEATVRAYIGTHRED